VGQEVAYDRRDLRGVSLQREVAGVEEAHHRIGDVRLNDSARPEGRMDRSCPHARKRRFVGPEYVLEGGVERDITFVIAEQVEL